MPMKTLSSKPKMGPFLPAAHLVGGKPLRRGLVIKASASSFPALVGGDSVGLLERCFVAPPALGGSDSASVSSAVSVGPVMKGQYGSLGSVTLEKGKLDMSQKQSKGTAIGGGGGDIRRKINRGGGDGGDNDYFDDFDDGDEGDEGGLFRRRKFLEEVGLLMHILNH
ncbi:hypothetical protein CJ030_MR7G008073 [Morella rubra]|uniref:Uncharacterized protein n=1 Tax=Morella rubra TaxID=262757 RepID=A0A6A1V317_9ROSI|nr:hypothetical protein CJ030_MR7G008073 [Morella rubra]